MGCHARLGEGIGASDGVDASTSTGDDSGTGSAGIDAGVSTPDAPPPACPNGRKVYLAFDGVTLTQAATSDSTQNRASWINNGTSVVPAWRPNSSTRAQDIATVVAGVKSRLAMTPIEVVTTRPTTGPYVMIVFGGRNEANGGTVGTIYSLATNEHDCGDLVKNDVGWVSESATLSYAPDLAVGAIGWGLGLNGTNDPTNCMCGWANRCESASGACSLSPSIATTQSLAPATTCPNMNPQNEIAAFTTKFCAP